MSQFVELVPFHDYQIATIRHGDDVRVALKPLVEAMGLDWSAQFRRVKRHPVLSEGIAITAIPSGHGEQESVVIALEMLPGFLATTAAERIKDPNVRERVILFQREAFHVLFEHFFGGTRRGRALSADRASTKERLMRAIDRLRAAPEPEARRVLHAIIVDDCGELGITPPEIDGIGAEQPDAIDLRRQFFAALTMLDDAGLSYDHSRNPELLAINMPEIRAAFEDQDIDVPITRPLRLALKLSRLPAFVGVKTVNSALSEKGVKCWVFRRERGPVLLN